MGTDPHSRCSRAVEALAGLLLVTVLSASSGCAIAWPLAGQFDPPAAGNETAAAVTVTDTAARVRANAAGDLVPVDAPAAGTAQIDDSRATRTSPRVSASEAPLAEPERRRPAGFGTVFRRLEAALDDSTSGPSPPPPPVPRTTGPASVSRRVVSRLIVPAGGSGSLIPPTAGSIPEFLTDVTSPDDRSETPRILDPAPAIAAVVRLPDVTDWSITEGSGSEAAVAGERPSASGSTAMARRGAPWWITVIGLVVMVGLIGLSRRLGWPSVSPLE